MAFSCEIFAVNGLMGLEGPPSVLELTFGFEIKGRADGKPRRYFKINSKIYFALFKHFDINSNKKKKYGVRVGLYTVLESTDLPGEPLLVVVSINLSKFADFVVVFIHLFEFSKTAATDAFLWPSSQLMTHFCKMEEYL